MAAPKNCFVYVGTYASESSRGIYTFRLDAASGALEPAGSLSELKNPSFLALHPSGRYLYAVDEITDFDGQPTGAVAALAVDRHTGALTLLNRQASRGTGPCHLSFDHRGRVVLVANYSGGSIAVLPVEPNGRVGEGMAVQHHGASVNPDRQQGPHPHAMSVGPDDRFAFVPDLGLDRVVIYPLDAQRGDLLVERVSWAEVEPGSGPRHLAFHPSGRHAYLLNEMASTVDVFAYDAERGSLTSLQTISALPPDFSGVSYGAEIEVHPSGRFVFASNRGHDSIAVMAIDSVDGTLTPVGYPGSGGKWPRHFALDPSGTYLLAQNQHSDNVVTFRIDLETGALEAVAETSVPKPVCIVMVPVED